MQRGRRPQPRGELADVLRTDGLQYLRDVGPLQPVPADAGRFSYATTKVQFDVRFGKRLSDRINEVFTGAGLSIRY